jgi:hypothetical protein
LNHAYLERYFDIINLNNFYQENIVYLDRTIRKINQYLVTDSNLFDVSKDLDNSYLEYLLK